PITTAARRSQRLACADAKGPAGGDSSMHRCSPPRPGVPAGNTSTVGDVPDEILDVDLLAFERGDAAQRRAVVDGVMRSLATGFVYTATDLSETMLDDAYGMLRRFFEL